MKAPILYFDRCVGREIPEALRRLGLANVYHQHLSPKSVGVTGLGTGKAFFPPGTLDDEWLHEVGKRRWIVIGQDYQFHRNESELAAIKQHATKVFYLWGAQATRWEKMCCFVRAYDRILAAVDARPGPFVFRVSKLGRLAAVRLDGR